ncbi:MAG: Y-family DNA polymerase [Bacteroidales bacterium]|nr:Y-family DNA polymerase [Bacteroidales bacterium]
MYCLVDCNNFFVSCERVFRPDLIGRPVVVLSNNDGCIVSRSNEAKDMGIPMGLPFFRLSKYQVKGRQEVTAFSSNYVLYGDLSSRVMSIVRETVGEIIPYSIDELYYQSSLENEKIEEQARNLRANILRSVGIPVSIGIAQTKTLAKVACHFAKKFSGYRGACMIDTEFKRQKALELTPIDDVWGIGRRTLPKLKKMGLSTALQLSNISDEVAHFLLKLPGLRTVKELQGIDCIASEDISGKQSICTSRSFASMLTEIEDLRAMTANFAATCANKLRKQRSVASMVTVFVLSNRFREDCIQYNNSANIVLPVAVSSTQEIVAAAIEALNTVFRPGVQYKKCGVILSCITSDSAVQTSLFDYDPEKRDHYDKIAAVMDAINTNAKHDAVYLGSQLPNGQRDNFKEELFMHNLRREHASPRATTNWDEIIEIH